MCKSLFASILRKKYQFSRAAIEGFWQSAIAGSLPPFLFDEIQPDLVRFPKIYRAYAQKLGRSPSISAYQAKILIIESLLEGPRYMSEFKKLFAIHKDMMNKIMAEMLEDSLITWSYCSIGNCISYSLGKAQSNHNLMRKCRRIVKEKAPLRLSTLAMLMEIDYLKACAMCGYLSQITASPIEIVCLDNGVIVVQ